LKLLGAVFARAEHVDFDFVLLHRHCKLRSSERFDSQWEDMGRNEFFYAIVR
jgi:hypothetical protein